MDVPLRQGTTQGRPDLFQGTSPGDRGPGFPYGTMAPSRVVNQTLGFQSNHTIPYAYVVRRFKDKHGDDKSLNKGQFVFIRRRIMPLQAKKLYTIMNVPQMNHLLYECARTGVDPAKYDPNDPKSARRILDEWVPHGVVQGEIGGPTVDQPQERLVNLIVMGRTPVFNHWGERAIKDGTPLWFVLRRMEVDATTGRRYQVHLDDTTTRNTDGRRILCWQWQPYADYQYHHPFETDSPLRDKDDDDKDVNGARARAVYVGRVSSKGYLHTHASAQHTERATYDVNKLVTLPQFEMFVDYGNTL